MSIDRVMAPPDRMDRDGATFCFTGDVSEDVLSAITKALKQNLDREDLTMNSAKGVFSTVVQLSQNIIRYSAEHPTLSAQGRHTDLGYGVLAVDRVFFKPEAMI